MKSLREMRGSFIEPWEGFHGINHITLGTGLALTTTALGVAKTARDMARGGGPHVGIGPAGGMYTRLPPPKHTQQEEILLKRQISALDQIEEGTRRKISDAYDLSQYIQDQLAEQVVRQGRYTERVEGLEVETPGGKRIRESLEQSVIDILTGKFSDPILEKNYSDLEEQMKRNLYNKLGPDFELSTPGLQRVSEFEEGRERARFSAKEEAMRVRDTLAQGRDQTRLQGEVAKLNLLGRTLSFGSENVALRGQQPSVGDIQQSGAAASIDASNATMGHFAALRQAQLAAAGGNQRAQVDVNRTQALERLRRSQITEGLGKGVGELAALGLKGKLDMPISDLWGGIGGGGTSGASELDFIGSTGTKFQQGRRYESPATSQPFSLT